MRDNKLLDFEKSKTKVRLSLSNAAAWVLVILLIIGGVVLLVYAGADPNHAVDAIKGLAMR